MKVLILSVPRSGTKLLQSYIHSYLNSTGPTLHINNSPTGLEDFLSPCSDTKDYRAYINGLDVQFDKNSNIDVSSEMRCRLQSISTNANNCVIKYLTLDTINDKILKCFDKIIVLKRLNSFDVALSETITEASGYHIKNISNSYTHKDYIKNTVIDPITINVNNFKKIYSENEDFIKDKFKPYYENLDYVEITYDELISIIDSNELCKLLNLPIVDFTLPNYIMKEFGEFKQLMINNMKELQNV